MKELISSEKPRQKRGFHFHYKSFFGVNLCKKGKGEGANKFLLSFDKIYYHFDFSNK